MAAKKIMLANFIDLSCENISKNNILKRLLRLKRKRFLQLLLEQNIPRKIPRSKNFTAAIEEMSDDIFFSHFKMSISTFQVMRN